MAQSCGYDGGRTAHNWFVAKFSYDFQLLEIGSCDCDGKGEGYSFYITTDKLPDKTMIPCAHTNENAWANVRLAPALHMLSSKGQKPTKAMLVRDILAWLKIVGRNALLDSELAVPRMDIAAAVRDVPFVDNDISRAMTTVPFAWPPPFNSMKPSKGTTRGLEEIGHDLTRIPDPIPPTSPETLWVILNPDADFFVEVFAAGLAHLGEIALRHGLPCGIALPELYRAWQTGDALGFVRALEPLALLFWSVHLLREHAGAELVVNTLHVILTTDKTAQPLEVLRGSLPIGSPAGTSNGTLQD